MCLELAIRFTTCLQAVLPSGKTLCDVKLGVFAVVEMLSLMSSQLVR